MAGENTFASLGFKVGSRVIINGLMGAMVAEIQQSEGVLCLATDDAKWLNFTFEGAKELLKVDDHPEHGLVDGKRDEARRVSALHVECGQIVGCFIGRVNETMLGGQIKSFYEHVAKPFANTKGTRSGGGHQYREPSLACGDILAWKGDTTLNTRAAVQRVLYAPKVGSGKHVQQRKLLVMMELGAPGSTQSAVFPASWNNWQRLPLNPCGWGKHDSWAFDAPRLTLDCNQMVHMEQESSLYLN